jgi:hypothetical protein
MLCLTYGDLTAGVSLTFMLGRRSGAALIQTPQPDSVTRALLLRPCSNARAHLHRFCNMGNEFRTCRALTIKKTTIEMRQGIVGKRGGETGVAKPGCGVCTQKTDQR